MLATRNFRLSPPTQIQWRLVSSRSTNRSQQRHFLPRFFRRFLFRYPNAPVWAFGILSTNLLLSRLWYDAYQVYKKGYDVYYEELGGDQIYEREKSKWKYGDHLRMPFSNSPIFMDSPDEIQWRKRRDNRIRDEQMSKLLGDDWQKPAAAIDPTKKPVDS